MSLLTRSPGSRRVTEVPAPADTFAREPVPVLASHGDPVLDHAPLDGTAALREAPRIYTGRTVEELIPQIVGELGPDAVVLRHERGLTGGFAGFFRRPYVEVEAAQGGPRFDRYDEEDGAVALPGGYEEGETGDFAAVEAVAAGVFPAPTAHELHAPPSRVAHAPSAPVPPLPGAFAAELASAEAAEPVLVEELHAGDAPCAEPFVEDQDQYELPLPAVDSAAPAAPRLPASVAVSCGPARETIERSLLGAGMEEHLVRDTLEAATAHVLPLLDPVSPPVLAGAVRRALAQRIPVCRPLPCGGAVVAFVGPGGAGKSSCCAALLDAYHRRSTLPATRATLVRSAFPVPVAGGTYGERPTDLPADLADGGLLDVLFPPHVPGPIPPTDPLAVQALARARGEGLLVLDTPSLSPADGGAIAALAATLAQLAPDLVVLALPATLGARSAARLLEAYRPLGTAALAVTHVDETDQLGVAVQVGCALGLAPAYLLERGDGGFALTQVEPADLASRLLPPQ